MKIYISGAIHNQPEDDDGRRGGGPFRNVANLISQLGHIPVVPHDIPAHHGQHGLECPPAYSEGAACYMRGDLIEMLANCDAVLMIGEWHHSVGAQREHSVACWTGMPIFYDARTLPDNRPLARTKASLQRVADHLKNVKLPEIKIEMGTKVTPDQLAYARELIGVELSDHTRELVESLDAQEKERIRENAVGANDPEEDLELRNFQLSWGHPEATRADMEATYAYYSAKKKEAEVPAEDPAQLAEGLRKYGHKLVDEDEWDGPDFHAVNKLVDQLAAWVAGERL